MNVLAGRDAFPTEHAAFGWSAMTLSYKGHPTDAGDALNQAESNLISASAWQRCR